MNLHAKDVHFFFIINLDVKSIVYAKWLKTKLLKSNLTAQTPHFCNSRTLLVFSVYS